MTAAVAGRAAAAVRSGGYVAGQTLGQRHAAARAAQGGGAPTPVKKAPATAPTGAKPAQQAPPVVDKATTAKPPTAPTTGWRPRLPTAGGTVGNAAGFVLGLLFWGWVILPLVHGGPTEVRNVIRAKFLNKAPDGSWLP